LLGHGMFGVYVAVACPALQAAGQMGAQLNFYAGGICFTCFEAL
jgi:hypothetical protein